MSALSWEWDRFQTWILICYRALFSPMRAAVFSWCQEQSRWLSSAETQVLCWLYWLSPHTKNPTLFCINSDSQCGAFLSLSSASTKIKKRYFPLASITHSECEMLQFMNMISHACANNCINSRESWTFSEHFRRLESSFRVRNLYRESPHPILIVVWEFSEQFKLNDNSSRTCKFFNLV